MADTITCPRCKDRLTVPSTRKAGAIRCPRCGVSQTSVAAGSAGLPRVLIQTGVLLALAGLVLVGCVGLGWVGVYVIHRASVKPAPRPEPEALAKAKLTPQPEGRPEGRPVRPPQPDLTPEVKPVPAQPEPAPEVKRGPPEEKPVVRPAEDSRAIKPDQFAKLLAMIKPHADEAKWEEIPWMTNLWEARKKAAAEGKPLFVWSASAESLGCT
jgi:hypothetical protein